MKPDHDARRKALKRVIKDHYANNVSAFARRVKKPQSQIQDMLANPPRKTFGEKVARELETRAALEPGALDIDPDQPADSHGRHSVRDVILAYGQQISRAEAAFGREWGKLQEPIRSLIEQLVEMLVVEQVRGGRKSPARKPKRDDDLPRPA